MTLVVESGIAAITNEPETTMAVAVAAAMAAVMERIAHTRANVNRHTTRRRACGETVYVGNRYQELCVRLR